MRRLSLDRKTAGGITLAACVVGCVLWAVRDRADGGETDPKLAPVVKLERKKDVAALTVATRDGDPAVAGRAVEALGNLAGARSAGVDAAAAREAIRPTFADPRPEVRLAAARAWATVAAPSDVSELRQALSGDDSPEVRRAAANALGQLRAWDGMNELVTAMNDADPLVRQCAFTGVFRTTGAKFQYNPDDRPDVRQAAVEMIRRMVPAMKPAHDDYMRRLRKD